MDVWELVHPNNYNYFLCLRLESRCIVVEIQAEYPVTISNPEKLLWPEVGVTKAHYMQYLVDMAPLFLKQLANRPLTMIRFPHGIHGHHFFQKNCPVNKPEWIQTTPIWSSDRQDVIHSILVDSIATLLWLANAACLEMHVGFDTITHPNEPDVIAFDLDPTRHEFDKVRKTALLLHEILENLQLPHGVKTSGATGLQIFVPLTPGHTFNSTRTFTKTIAEYALQQFPEIITLERLTKNRGNKVYIDYPQHGQKRTLIAAYSARATKLATVSAPLTWAELRAGACPEDFTIFKMRNRIDQIGDLFDFPIRSSLSDFASLLEQTPVFMP